MVLVVLLLAYSVRVMIWPGFYIVSYGLGIYLLNLLVDFLSPLDDPELAAGAEAELPTRSDDEYRPFIRKLPEFSTWRRATKALVFALIATAMPFLDVPVFWPVSPLSFTVALFASYIRPDFTGVLCDAICGYIACATAAHDQTPLPTLLMGKAEVFVIGRRQTLTFLRL